jgi:predicted Zn-ribbon and HTH transcriptional regulator
MYILHINEMEVEIMLKLLKRLFCKGKKLPAVETTETKKCMYCLRRVNINISKCPHCRKQDFEY